MFYIKQYGARRTGTNYLRALLEQNFEDITVLMHTLGGKHGAPVDLQTYLRSYADTPLEFVEATTAAIPAENSLPFSEEQISFMQAHASALVNAVSEKQLHFVISIKNPYAWINSMFKNVMYRKPDATEEMKIKLYELTKQQCIEYNTLYAAYWEHYQKNTEQTTIVRYEDLIENPSAILTDLSTRLTNNPISDVFSDIKTTAMPTCWDQMESTTRLDAATFNKDYYLQQNYLADLGAEMTQIIEETINWSLMMNFGYERIKVELNYVC